MTTEELARLWQPIETAPRDGTEILVGGGRCPYVHINAYRRFGHGDAILKGLGEKQQPSFWMSVPKAPQRGAVLDRPAPPQTRPFNWPPDKGDRPSKWCAKDDKESHGWCANRNASECHCTCNCHKRAESRPAPSPEDEIAIIVKWLKTRKQMTADREHGYDHIVWLSDVEAALLQVAASRPAPEPDRSKETT